MNRRRLLQAVAIAPILGAGTDSFGGLATRNSSQRIAPPGADFMATLPRLLEISSVPGICIGVLAEGKMIWEAHAGVADLGTGIPVGSNTLWRAVSLTKQVTGYAAMRMIDERTLELDRPIADYLDKDAPKSRAARRITARHVLTHTSGLPNWRKTSEIRTEFESGTKFRYSGEGYFYLARGMERIAGHGFEAYMRDTTFAPLRMSSSTYLWRPDLATRHRPWKCARSCRLRRRI